MRAVRLRRVALSAPFLVLIAGCGDSPELASRDGSPIQDRATIAPGAVLPTRYTVNPLGRDSATVAAGKTLFAWYNCNGCHAPDGGGGMGPPLSDAEWIYGSDPQALYETITRGRPKGMPSWGGRIPNAHVWTIIAYIHSLSDSTQGEAIPQPADTTYDSTRVAIRP